VLFLITRPQLSEIMQRRVDISAMQATDAFSLQGIIILLEVAIAEEIVFRLGIQNFLGRLLKDRSYWIAIALTSAIWTLGHAGVLQPDWVKLAQIFPIGLVLGWLYRKYGVESTIIVHSIFNVVLGLLSIQLIQ
jgi:membrane protease YdiL (CAAX protease family)